jgi:hypothetical protein
MEITLPNNWTPRPYQMNTWAALERGIKRIFLLAHRRWGKDEIALHWTATQVLQKPANYWHMLPEYAQARKAIWEAINPHTGKRRIDEAFPQQIRKRTVDQDMKIEFINGSIWQVVGSDSYDRLVGSTPYGVIFSEWALADPACWSYISPMLEENGGYAFFITTPRGNNHAKKFYDMAVGSPAWFCELSDVTKTKVFSQEQLDIALSESISVYGKDEGTSKFNQEFHCSFNAAISGAYFGAEMIEAENKKQITFAPYLKGKKVFCAFDFGRGESNSTSIWFVQVVDGRMRCFDYFEDANGSLDKHLPMLQSKGYVYGGLVFPHDAAPKRYGNGLSYADQARELGFNVIQLQNLDKAWQRTAARRLIDVCLFNKETTERGIDCLKNYCRDFDHKLNIMKPTPKHDWASHGADSFQYLASAWTMGLLDIAYNSSYDDSDYDEYDDDRSEISGY